MFSNESLLADISVGRFLRLAQIGLPGILYLEQIMVASLHPTQGFGAWDEGDVLGCFEGLKRGLSIGRPHTNMLKNSSRPSA